MFESTSFKPDWVSSPGDTISDILEEQSCSQTEFARQIGCPTTAVSDLLEGHTEITPELAVRIATIVGGTAKFWLNRERQYREAIVEQTQEWLRQLPLRDMRRFGWIDSRASGPDVAAACFGFFGVPNVTAWRAKYSVVIEATAFRTSPAFRSQPAAVAAWLREGEIRGEELECKPWSSERFRSMLNDVRALTRKRRPEVFLPELVTECAHCGVAVVILRAPEGCRASGATRFISGSKALLLLSFRYLSDDHFWFTFFHEAGHLLLHGKDALFLEGLKVTNEREEEANRFSASTLIPSEFRPELARLPIERHAIRDFARRVGVSPGIVVGQLQHLGKARYSQLTHLKIRYRWEAGED